MADNQRPDGVDRRIAEDIPVPSEDPAGKENKEKTYDPKGKAVDGKKETKEEEMSDEDIQLKNELEMLVERLKESDATLYNPSLESLRTLIKTSTSSMTSVPKPLKFLRPFYNELISLSEKWNTDELEKERALCCSIISVLAMTYSDNGQRDTLHYRITSGSKEAPGDWGNEYVRHLASEIGEEYSLAINGEVGVTEPTQEPVKPTPKSADAMAVDDSEKVVTGGTESIPAAVTAQQKVVRPLKSRDQLLSLALELVPFFLQHNAEADAVDLLLELESIESLATDEFLNKETGEAIYSRVCQYMVSCAPLLVSPDDRAFLRTAAAIYAKHERYTQAIALAVRLRDRKLIRKYFEAPMNHTMKKQLAFFLARAQVPIHWLHCSEPESWTPPEDDNDSENSEMATEETAPPMLEDDILECLGNLKLTEHFKRFGKQLDVSEPKSLEDIYKSHLETNRSAAAADSARANLAGTFVNAFVNAGFGNDKLIVDVEEGQSFIYKNKDHGMMSATASLGLSMLWDTEVGISQVDKYSYSSEEHIKAGALLATGILHNGVRTELDVAYALLEEHVDNPSTELKVAAINGIALACVGSCRQDIADKLLPYIAEETASMEVAANAALALGFVFVGSANGDIAITIVQSLMERLESTLDDKWARFIALALGLVYLGRQEASEATIELLKTIEHPLGKQAEILVDVCSYAATGNVLKIQTMLHHCADHAPKPKTDEEDKAETPEQDTTAAAAEGESKEEKKEDAKPSDMTYQAFAVIGIALVAMGEDVGADMSLRQFNHLMSYGDPIVRKAVPLALGLISASNPQLPILDNLSRYSHDNDLEVAVNAILAMGLVGAGTNNARLAQMLRSLAGYYAKEPNCLFMVRIAQGLVHMGKGTIGINPFYNDRQILSPSATAGLLSLLVSFTDAQSFVLEKSHWMMYWLVSAMYPRFLITLDEQLEEKAITVRVGQAVNTVGLAGQRMGISGFQTHQTPVRIAVGERAEFGTNEYFPYASTLEGIVIIKKNDLYDAEDKDMA